MSNLCVLGFGNEFLDKPQNQTIHKYFIENPIKKCITNTTHKVEEHILAVIHRRRSNMLNKDTLTKVK
jgi:hypothetical protein